MPVSRDQLRGLCAELRVTLVGLDVAPPEGHRYPEPEVSELPDVEPWEPVQRQLLYVASRPMRSWTDLVELELQPDKRGRLMALAYTSEDELAAGCGPHQAWVAIPSDLIGEAVGAASVAEQTGANVDTANGAYGGFENDEAGANLRETQKGMEPYDEVMQDYNGPM